MGEKANLTAESEIQNTRLKYAPQTFIERVLQSDLKPLDRAAILADIFRVNALYMITQAGSGHIGSSFSCLDILAYLWTIEMKNPNRPDQSEFDLFFSSKGHDSPAVYAAMTGLGRLDFNLIHELRRLGGLPGHPDVSTPGIITNTGSLGMGVAKARGMMIAARLNKKQARAFVITGDGELQEGQIWESLQPTANGGFGEITLIVDHNKIQSDTWVKDVSDLGDIEAKFRAFGWETARCDGHDFAQIDAVFARFRKITDRPKVLIADTRKGQGVSFMQMLTTTEDGTYYKFHSGAPSQMHYAEAFGELEQSLRSKLTASGARDLPAALSFSEAEQRPRPAPQNPEKLIAAYGDELVRLAAKHPDLIALDADLVLDTGLIPFSRQYPERFIECGIAEQDMVSTAGGLALMGKLPIVHSFACFLSTRPNEQIYNNATEKTKIIYVGSLAGLLPAGPGHSHQSVRDISCLGAVPGLTLIEPCNEQETRLALRWAVEESKESVYIRLVSIPSETPYALPENYALKPGCGVTLRPGRDALVFAYGPTMLTPACRAAEALARENVSVQVVNFPWLNRVDANWLKSALDGIATVLILDDHLRDQGLGEKLAAALAEQGLADGRRIVRIGLNDTPLCGRNDEILAHYRLDPASLAEDIKRAISGASGNVS